MSTFGFGEKEHRLLRKESGTSEGQERREALNSAEGAKPSMGLEEAKKTMGYRYKKAADDIQQIANGWGPLKNWRIKRVSNALAQQRLEEASPEKAHSYLYRIFHPWERRAALVASRENVYRDLQSRFEADKERLEQLQQRYRNASSILRGWVRKPFTVRELKRSNYAITRLRGLQNSQKMQKAFSRLTVQKTGLEMEAIIVAQLSEAGLGEADTRRLIIAHKQGRKDLLTAIEGLPSKAVRDGLARAAKWIRKYKGRYELAGAIASDVNALPSDKKLDALRKPAIVGCGLEVVLDDGVKTPLVVQSASLPLLTVKNMRTGKKMILDTRGKKGHLTYRGKSGIVDLPLHGTVNRLSVPQETCARLAFAGDEATLNQAA